MATVMAMVVATLFSKDQERVLVSCLQKACLQAGGEIMSYYGKTFDIDYKQDGSVVTKADKAAEDIIFSVLTESFADIPIVSEEAFSRGVLPSVHDRFFLVDPLDGTREFVEGHEDFTVNIALIHKGNPVYGAVYAPVRKCLFYTKTPTMALRCHVKSHGASPNAITTLAQPLKAVPVPQKNPTLLVSRSHAGPLMESFIHKVKPGRILRAGSSLKFCMAAQGEGHLYPRLTPTMLWDTAAGHSVLRAAGGCVLVRSGVELSYGKVSSGGALSSLTHGSFLAASSQDVAPYIKHLS